jgi:circadian clock protein KaiC
MDELRTNIQPTTISLRKSPTGIQGLDEVLNGGIPEGRPTLLCGGPGCGKTLIASLFLVHGALEYDEPGVFIAFEETEKELVSNLASLDIDMQDLIDRQKILIDYIHLDRSEIEETGEYDLDGLFIRLASAIESVGAKRVVLDTIESIFTSFSNETILRSELRRLFRWLKARGVTAIITAERGDGSLTRNGLEEYVSDCVILLDHRLRDGIANRLLWVVKYRGSNHGNDEYPFLIDEKGIWMMPITSINLDYPVSREFISTSIPRLDTMLDGKGYYRGSSILISGTAGTGKTSLALSLADDTCRRGESCLYFAFEESPDQIIRNMRSVDIDLERWIQQGLLHFSAMRPSLQGIEMHLLSIQKLIREINPNVVVIDPINNLTEIASSTEVKSMLVRMIDFLKMHKVTALFTSLTEGGANDETTDVGVSSLMDTWILLKGIEHSGERDRVLYVLKSRGMAHSNQVREFRLTDQGLDLTDVYVGSGGVLTGTARLNQEAIDKEAAAQRKLEVERLKRELERKRRMLQAQIANLQDQFEAEVDELQRMIDLEEDREQLSIGDRQKIAKARWADSLSE